MTLANCTLSVTPVSIMLVYSRKCAIFILRSTLGEFAKWHEEITCNESVTSPLKWRVFGVQWLGIRSLLIWLSWVALSTRRCVNKRRLTLAETCFPVEVWNKVCLMDRKNTSNVKRENRSIVRQQLDQIKFYSHTLWLADLSEFLFFSTFFLFFKNKRNSGKEREREREKRRRLFLPHRQPPAVVYWALSLFMTQKSLNVRPWSESLGKQESFPFHIW